MSHASLQTLHIGIYLLGLLVISLALHELRIRKSKGPFVMLMAFLWFLAYLLGHLNLKFPLPLAGKGLFWEGTLSIRYSSATYTLIFANLLLVYITEGVAEARDLIWVSLGAQAMLALMQVFFYSLALPMLGLSAESQIASELIFHPSLWRLSVGAFTAVLDLFFVVLAFQFFSNRLQQRFLVLPLMLSLVLTMALDSIVFNALTRPQSFWTATSAHLIYKTAISVLLTGPLALYLTRFSKKGHLELRRGSFDIFKKLSQMEEDLARANEQLRRHNEELESLVAERTAELEEKQRQINLELQMAAELQQAMLPHEKELGQIQLVSEFLPCSVVSGDLFTYGKLEEEHYFCFMGDISGHGVASALVGAMCAMSLSRLNLRRFGPAEVLRRISRDITESSQDHYLTGVYLDIDTKKRIFTYASGAHVSPLLVTPSGKHAFLEPTGSLIGTDLGIRFEERRVRYTQKTRLFLFTDCLIEHKNMAHEEYGQERLLAIAKRHLSSPLEESKEAILKDLEDFGDGRAFSDDLSLLVLELP